jgi:hypothetical protein
MFNFTKSEDYSLPEMERIKSPPLKGRSVKEGYARSLGIRYGQLKEQVEQDPIFRQAISAMGGRTLLGLDQLINIFLIMKFHLGKIPAGDIIEFGCYRGGCSIFMATVAKKLFPKTHVWALDTFSGIPTVDHSVDDHMIGHFGDANLDEIRTYVATLGLDNLSFVEGTFKETAAPTLLKASPISLAHIDCDVYASVVTAWDSVKASMLPGGYVIFDDALAPSCMGATEAVEEMVIQRDGLLSEQIFPHQVFRYGAL